MGQFINIYFQVIFIDGPRNTDTPSVCQIVRLTIDIHKKKNLSFSKNTKFIKLHFYNLFLKALCEVAAAKKLRE